MIVWQEDKLPVDEGWLTVFEVDVSRYLVKMVEKKEVLCDYRAHTLRMYDGATEEMIFWEIAGINEDFRIEENTITLDLPITLVTVA